MKKEMKIEVKEIQHRVIIQGWDEEANDKPLEVTVCYDGQDEEDMRTVSFPQYNITVNSADLFDAIEYLQTR